MLSAKYGWTPDQIRQMSEDDISAYLDIMYYQNKHEQNQLKKLKKR